MATFKGGEGRDRRRGTREDDTYDGAGGNDRLAGGAGADTLVGGGGADELRGGGGRDYLAGGETTSARGDVEQDVLLGGGGYDFILGGYNDIIDGGDGSAYLTLDWSTLSVFRGSFGASNEFSNGTGWVRNVGSIVLEMTEADDVLRASGRYLSSVDAGGGNDRLHGGRNPTSFYGDDGDDYMVPGRGETYFYGGDGFDTISYAAHDGAIVVELTNYRFAGGSVDRVVDGRPRSDRVGDVEHLIGTAYDDTIVGGGTGDWEVPDSPPPLEWLAGGGGDDVIDGRYGDDRLDGGVGDDTLIGGMGLDVLIGGAGTDRFIFRSYESGGVGKPADRIMDFTGTDDDRIDLSQFDGNRLILDRQGLIFIGDAAPTGRAGELWYTTIGSTSFFHIDTDGDGATNFDVRLNGVTALTAADFTL